MRSQPTTDQLAEAHRVSRCVGSLDDALASPVLSILLRNTALALAKKSIAAARPQVIDQKRRAAGDTD